MDALSHSPRLSIILFIFPPKMMQHRRMYKIGFFSRLLLFIFKFNGRSSRRNNQSRRSPQFMVGINNEFSD